MCFRCWLFCLHFCVFVLLLLVVWFYDLFWVCLPVAGVLHGDSDVCCLLCVCVIVFCWCSFNCFCLRWSIACLILCVCWFRLLLLFAWWLDIIFIRLF